MVFKKTIILKIGKVLLAVNFGRIANATEPPRNALAHLQCAKEVRKSTFC